MRPRVVILLLIAGISGFARGGVVRTTDGREIEGTLNLADGQVLVQPKTGQIIRVDAASVAGITFGAEDAGRAGEGELPAGWTGRDVGSVGLVGAAGLSRGAYTIAGSGGGIEGKADAFHFMYQGRIGDVDLVVRLARMQNTHEAAATGLMIREDDQPGGRFVALLVRPNNTVRLRVREKAAGPADDSEPLRVALPLWLKLTRRGDKFAGHWSEDGQSWTRVEDEKLALRPDALVGLAVTSHDNGLLCTARYEELAVTGEQPTGDAVDDARTVLSSGVILRDGTTLTGAVRELAEGHVTLARFAPGGQQELTIAKAQVARVVCRPVTGRALAGIVPGSSGVLLGGGDFFAGEISAIDGGKVTVSSVLLGIRVFSLSSDVAILALADVREPQGAVTVRGRDGSVLVGPRLGIERDQIMVDHPVLGRVALSKAQVESVRVER